jgi:glutathione S-transferase
MTMKLYGSKTCTACNQAVTLLGRTPLDWQYVDVASVGYEGDIPVLELEDGKWIQGLGAIAQFIKNQGF